VTPAVNLWDLRVLVTRWYATAVGLLVTALICVAAVTLFPMQYEAKASLLFLPPVKAVGPGGNPYLDLGGLQGFADVAKLAVLDPTSEAELKQAGAEGTFEVAPDITSAGPVLLVTANATSNEDALNTLRLVLERFPPTVKQVQDAERVPVTSQITTKVITRDTKALALTRGPLRVLIVALAAGLGLTFLGTSLLDGYLKRRSNGRAPATGAPAAAAPPGPAPNGMPAGPAAAPAMPHGAWPVTPAPAQPVAQPAPPAAQPAPPAAQPAPPPAAAAPPGGPAPAVGWPGGAPRPVRASSHGPHNVVAFPQPPNATPAVPARQARDAANGEVWARPASQAPDTAPNPAARAARSSAAGSGTGAAAQHPEFDRLLGPGTQPMPVANGKAHPRRPAPDRTEGARNGTDNESPPSRT
jgi:hypothetical protein